MQKLFIMSKQETKLENQVKNPLNVKNISRIIVIYHYVRYSIIHFWTFSDKLVYFSHIRSIEKNTNII